MPVLEDDEPVHAPHPPLEAYYEGEEGRRPFVRRIFDQTAEDYDRIERLMALGSGPWYRRQALVRAGLIAGMSVLDVATGTGLVAREAAAIVGKRAVVGVDPSAGMLRSSGKAPVASIVRGAAEALPFATDRFDFLSMGFALRHMPDLEDVFAEFFRVLRPGGRVLILEITRPRSGLPRALIRAYLRGLVPLLARVFGRRAETATLMRYYWDTIETCAAPERVMATLAGAGFAGVSRYVELGIFTEYTGTKP